MEKNAEKIAEKTYALEEWGFAKSANVWQTHLSNTPAQLVAGAQKFTSQLDWVKDTFLESYSENWVYCLAKLHKNIHNRQTSFTSDNEKWHPTSSPSPTEMTFAHLFAPRVSVSLIPDAARDRYARGGRRQEARV